MKRPLDYAVDACETMMRRHRPEDLPPKRHFHYHQGVFLSGMYETFLLCGDERYMQYIRDWIDSVFDREGRILEYSHGDLDDIQIGDVCIGTGVGDYAHYCSRPVSVNDLHGVGAFLLMCTEMQRLEMFNP